MLSARNLPHAEVHGLRALHRSRRWALLCLGLGLGLCLAMALYAPSVRTISASTPPLRLDMRRLPQTQIQPQTQPQPPALLLQLAADQPFAPILASVGPFSVALPLKPKEPEVKTTEKKEEPPPQEAKPAPNVVSPVPAKPKLRTPKPQPVPPKVPHTVAATKATASAKAELAGQGKNVDQERRETHGQELDQHQKSTALGVLMQAIERHKSYPRQARRSGAQGTAFLLVQVGQDGKVASCTVRQSSGYAVLDGATRQLGQRLTGLDTGVRGRGMQVIVPVQYNLR